jgi:hypothetical protein
MKLDGLKGEEYLEKARVLSKEMRLESALEKLDRVVETRKV